MMFCKYKNIFGEVNQGIHSYRLFNIAIVDFIFTILFGLILHIIFPNFNLVYTLIILFLLGIIAHRIFCVRTTIDKLLFEN
jgi:hypothetical protein